MRGANRGKLVVNTEPYSFYVEKNTHKNTHIITESIRKLVEGLLLCILPLRRRKKTERQMETKLTKESINSNNTIVNFNSRACKVRRRRIGDCTSRVNRKRGGASSKQPCRFELVSLRGRLTALERGVSTPALVRCRRSLLVSQTEQIATQYCKLCTVIIAYYRIQNQILKQNI